MIQLAQGDIFEVGLRERRQLIAVFGHLGLNELRLYYQKFRDQLSGLQLSADPFRPFNSCRFIALSKDQHIVFIAGSENNGLRDEEMSFSLHLIYRWAKEAGKKTIIANGIRNIDHGKDTLANRVSDERRVRLIFELSKEYCSDFDSIKLISLNDAFVRNAL